PCTFSVIFHFIPSQGQFDPCISEHLHNIEQDNDLPTGSIASASWCKCLEKRSPGQFMATLKVTCSSLEAANHLLTGCIHVEDHLTNACKYLRIPIRCVK
ncbi:hypothetical protein F5148DRAFT_966344, partial [Russula earlei]